MSIFELDAKAATYFDLMEQIDALTAEAEAIIAENAARRARGLPGFRMFDEAFLTSAFEDARRIMEEGLMAFADGDPSWGARRD